MNRHLLNMANAVRSAVSAVPRDEWGREVGTGASGSATSLIDRAAEDAIVRYLDENHVGLSLLSEEVGFVDRGFPDILVADPLDGTHNACAGIPYYSVSLAAGRGSLSGMAEGLVMNLVTGDVFRASRGRGATLNGEPIHAAKPGRDRLLIAYTGAAAVPRTYDILPRFRRTRCLGSTALELCAVACGQADAFFVNYSDLRKSPRIVDIAAGVLILREAGGEAYDENDEILDMPLSLDERRNMCAVGSEEARVMLR